MASEGALVVAVAASPEHGIGKKPREAIRLVEGVGVEGDAHAGRTVQHLSRKRREPERPNLRQVHLIHAELHEELRGCGFDVAPSEMGENVTTRGLDLLALPEGTVLRLGAEATVEITGLRTPCKQLNGIAPGLMDATLDRDDAGELVRKAGVMAIVVHGGEVRAGDPIAVEPPSGEPKPLRPV